MKSLGLHLSVTICLLFLSCQEKTDYDHTDVLTGEQVERLGYYLKNNVTTLNLDKNNVEKTYIEINEAHESSLLLESELIGLISDIYVDDSFVYVTDSANNQVFKYNKNNGNVDVVGQQGRGPLDFNNPRQIEGNAEHILVYERDNHRIQVLDKELKAVTTIDVTLPPYWSIILL